MGRRIIFIILILVVLASSTAYGFYKTGGMKLVKMVKFANTLNPTKKKALMDQFVYNKVTNEISGFYAFTYNYHIYFWTMRGLYSYRIHPTTIYYGFDMCLLLTSSNSFTTSERTVTRQERHRFSDFLALVKKGDYVTVRTLSDNNKYYIYKIWAYSGDFYMDASLRQECQ